ncbi:MAG: hypothetical protein IKF90_01060 [Parasporobacterium sp.]|nr:hypothetical protein [Parasporobacterium sp.]
MKKFNINSLLFIAIMIFIIIGICGTCFTRLKWGTIDMLAAMKHFNFTGIVNAKKTIDDVSSEELSYHDLMMDIESLRNNLLGTRVIFKDDTTVVKADSGSLIGPVNQLSRSEIAEVVSCIQELKEVSEENGANFLYCAAPAKEQYEQAPSNIKNYSKENMELFINELQESQIPVIDFSKSLGENGINDSNLFYQTDHHWTARSGFVASVAICEELSSRYGFSYNKQYTDLNNYSITCYPNWFLGSKGRKVGTFFTWQGADDFELITPLFDTDFTELQPYKNEIREGSFEETVLFTQNLEKDYYHKITYATYSGGDFRLQIMKNNTNPGGKKILLVRSSFACVVAPFLALQTSELHICDMRDKEYYVGAKINLKEYIQEIKPDYVIVLYSSVYRMKGSAGRYDFF